MMFRPKLAAFLIAGSLFGFSAPASAVVVYDITFNNNPGVTGVLTLNDPTASTNYTGASLAALIQSFSVTFPIPAPSTTFNLGNGAFTALNFNASDNLTGVLGSFIIGSGNQAASLSFTATLAYAYDAAGAGPSNTTSGIVVTQVAAVPEPSTWAMMILGFFGVGFMAYRRKGARPQLRLA
jgi:hypothetical protein